MVIFFLVCCLRLFPKELGKEALLFLETSVRSIYASWLGGTIGLRTVAGCYRAIAMSVRFAGRLFASQALLPLLVSSHTKKNFVLVSSSASKSSRSI